MNYNVTGYYFKLFSQCAEVESCHEMIFVVNYTISRDNLLLILSQIVCYTNFIY